MKITLKEHAKFGPDKMTKIALATTPRAQVDLYCLAPGQEQKPHAHEGQDKIYVVLEGRARVVVGAVEEMLGPGEAVVAAAGLPHGIRNGDQAPLVALVIVTPPPPHA
jgi:mannose-6-phosphate isomerase-like protein (cupin superfamily)